MPMKQSDAEYRRQRAAMSTADAFRKEAETFDASSVTEVDRRLAQCKHLLALACEAVAHDGMGPSTRRHSASIIALTAQHEALEGIRRDLLTAGADREASQFTPGFEQQEPPWERDHQDHMTRPVSGPPHKHPYDVNLESGRHGPLHDDYEPLRDPGDYRGQHRASLSHRDRRYVALESAKFLQANLGIPADELAIRARHHAELQTSTFSVPRSRAVTAAFIEKVASLHRDIPRPRVAAIRPTSVPVGPDEQLFL